METRRALVGAMSCAAVLWGGISRGQEPAQEPPPQEERELPAAPGAEEAAGPTPGAPTIGLSRSVAVALQGNFGLRGTVDALSSAQLRESSARAQFYPKLTPRYTRSTDDETTFGLDASQRLPWSGGSVTASGSYRTFAESTNPASRSSDLRVTLTQPLLRGFGPTATYFDLTNSRRGRQAQERQLELARQRLAVDVTAAFYQVVKQRQLLAVARQSLARSENLQAASEARVKVGLASKLDVLRAQLQASQAQEAMVASQSGLETALEQFRILLGLSPTDPVEPEAASLPDSLGDAPVEPLEILVARAFEHRLDLMETRDQVRDQERSAAVARQNLLPQLDVNVALSQTGFGTSFSDTFKTADRRLSLFLSTTYPLERTSDRTAKAQAELDLEARRRSLKQREFDTEAEVRAAVRTLDRIRKSVELQRKGVEYAEQQHRLATLRYQRGLASNFDVVDAEGSLVTARTALVGLLTDYQIARIQLLRVVGTLDVSAEFGP